MNRLLDARPWRRLTSPEVARANAATAAAVLAAARRERENIDAFVESRVGLQTAASSAVPA